jgi:putative transposase
MDENPYPDRRRPAHFPVVKQFNRSSIIFVTVCTKDRQPLLANPLAQETLIAAWKEASFYLVGRYVLMPDHVHLFCAPGVWPTESLARWVRMWKSVAARRWPGQFAEKLWQREFWDTQLRRGESYSAKWKYVWNNPVRAGLVADPSEWPFQGELNLLRWHQ